MTTSVITSRSQLVNWRNAVFVLFAVNGFGAATWIARTPAIRDALDITIAQMGFLLVGISGGSIVGLLLSSHLLHWLGTKRTILGSLAIASVGLLLMGLGTEVLASYAFTFLGLALYGFGTGLCDVAMNVEGAVVERTAKKNLMPLMHAFWSLGTVAGAGVGAAAAYADVGVGIHLGVVSGLMLVTAFVATRPLRGDAIAEPESATDRKERSGFAARMAIWLEPRTLLIGLIVLGMAFAEGSANDWLALAMVDERDVSYATGALLFGVFTVAMTVGRVLGGPLLDRFGRVPVLRVSAALAVVGLLAVIFIDQPVVMVSGIVLWGLGASLGFPVGISAAADDPAKAAARVSAVATIGYLAFLAGPPLIGVLGDNIGLLRALLVVVVLITVAGLVSFAAREPAANSSR
ncbi:MFS transporter [Lysobacter korlensis]|uniref:MFS transporter n=1 Tax=Lysobacter korlensis TaxID=553636 RepID=A0ABV6RTF9_9GAMM